MKKLAAILSIIIILGTGAVALDLWRINAQKQASVFFSTALKARHISATIVVAGVSYSVTDGKVTNTKGNITDKERFDALRIAYARTMAQRSPLLAIPGTDPDMLDKAATSLTKIAAELAAAQKDRINEEAVRSSLYPVDFLHSLAALERSRKKFIQSGSDADATGYEHASIKAVQTFEKDLRLHKAAFARIVPEEAAVYQVFEGAITRESLLNSMDALMRGMQQTEAVLEKQRTCISGSVSACDASRLKLPALEPAAVLPADTTVFLREITSSYASATGKGSYATSPVFELASSVCIGNLDTPLLFVLVDRKWGADTVFTIAELVGDIFFVPTASYKDIPYYRYFLNNQIAYVYFPVWEHYKCPEIALDTARIFEVNNIRGAAQVEQFSRYAQGADAAALRELEARLTHPSSGVVRESDAKEYIALALRALSARPGTPPEIIDILLDITITRGYGTARFDQFVYKMANDEAANIGLMRANIPVELGAEYLFYVRSGFFSLFQGTNPSVAGTQRPPVNETARPAQKFPFVRYTELRATVPQSELLRAMTFFSNIHIKASREVMPTR